MCYKSMCPSHGIKRKKKKKKSVSFGVPSDCFNSRGDPMGAVINEENGMLDL